MTICTYGIMLSVALDAAEKLAAERISAAVVKLNDLTSWDNGLLCQSVETTGNLLVLEDCCVQGCLGQQLAETLLQKGKNFHLKLCNLGQHFVPQGTVDQLYTALGIDANGVAAAVKEMLNG